MSSRFVDPVLTLALVSLLLLGCKAAENLAGNKPANTAANVTESNSSEPTKASNSEFVPSETGVEKEKPTAGKANVQGKALYNEQPASGVEVKLCKTFNRFAGGCTGETFTTKTDENGEYVIKNVPPGVYEGLTVRVFNTPYYVFATSGYVSAAKYNIEADKTYFAPESNLFKNDLKLTAPKNGAKAGPENVEVKWEPYQDAAYYKLSIFGDSASGAETPLDYVNKRVDDVSAIVEKPLKLGSYNIRVEAYNANDIKLSQNSSDMKFSVK